MSVLSALEVKSLLNLETDANDIDLQRCIDQAEDAIAAKCGPLEATSITERVRGGGTGLVLRTTPVISLTSVTPVDGSAYTLADLDLDKSAGVIEWGSGARFTTGRYDVVYSAGRASLPDDLKRGVIELVRHLFDVKRGGRVRTGAAASEVQSNTLASSAYLFPYRVMECIAPYVQIGN